MTEERWYPSKYNRTANKEDQVKVGDKVIYTKYGGSEIKIDDVEMMILRESDILAVKKGQ